ncbi:hypothetical protein SVIOM342S_08467 [Streptomyces violaceorubidus]
MTVRQLLYGLMLPSGCDAAYALADKFGSGKTRAARVKSFIGKMNSTAKSLGLKNTHFDSFDGIGHGKNYSTPRDLTKLASNAMKNSTFRTIVKTKKYTAKTKTKKGGTRTMAPWTNTNTLLGSYSGAIGVKTGSGPEAQVLPGLRRDPEGEDRHRHCPGVLVVHAARQGRHEAHELRLREVDLTPRHPHTTTATPRRARRRPRRALRAVRINDMVIVSLAPCC